VEPPMDVAKLDNYALGVGRICHQKGFDIFAETARRLPLQKFIWVGDAQAEKDISADSLPSNLTLIPYIPHAELLDMIRKSRMILLPSRWEGLSRFLIESVCLGKAIVTSLFPANLDCLDSSTPGGYANGFACQSLDDYTAAVSALGQDDHLLTIMQAASHRYAGENFNIHKITDQWRELYYSC
jgi:glycosyltransferase involved in cell wall biosynthesis